MSVLIFCVSIARSCWWGLCDRLFWVIGVLPSVFAMDCSVCRQIESPCVDTYCMLKFLVSGVVRFHYPHTRDQTEKTALILASWNGDAECVRLLLDAGADKNAKDRVRG